MKKLNLTILLLFITTISVAQKSALIITNLETGIERQYTFGKHTKLITDKGLKFKGNLKLLNEPQSVVVLRKDTIALTAISVFKIRSDAVSLTGTLLTFTGGLVTLIGVVSLFSNSENAAYINPAAILGVGIGLTGAGIATLAIHKKYDRKKYNWRINN